MNAEQQLFNPLDLEMSRSTFHYSPTYTGTCTAGTLVPSLAFEVLPGDSIKMDLNALIKMSTPVYPTMDNLYCDIAFYFVPNKLVLGRRYGTPSLSESNQSWKAIIGAQDNLVNMPLPANGIQVPYVAFNLANASGSLPDHLGIPSFANSLSGKDVFENASFRVSALPFLSYFAIWNENYRDPNTMDPVTWNFGTNGRVLPQGNVPVCLPGSLAGPIKATAWTGYQVVNAIGVGLNGSNPANDANYWSVFPTCRFHGYLGSALPWPQRNSTAVELPLGNRAPVVTMSDDHLAVGDTFEPLKIVTGTTNSAGNWEVAGNASSGYPLAANSNGEAGTNNAAGTPAALRANFANLYADLSSATAANVNALRAAVAQQRWYEKLARSGNTYDSLKYGLFAVRGMDALSDRPLYLGGKRIPLRMDMVASTQGSTSASPAQGAASLGALGAFSHTNNSDNYFYHSFDDWGIVMCVMTIRAHTTASNVFKRAWMRQTRDNYYFPTMAHLGEQAVGLVESGVNASGVFGYQEAWQEYRWEPDVVTGLFKSGQSLSYMTYAEDFNTLFGSSMTLADYLNASYQVQAIDKTLAVDSTSAKFQFIYQLNFDFSARRCMPVYSIPGLMDHF